MEDTANKPISLDLLNKVISYPSTDDLTVKATARKISPDLIQKFLQSLDPFWHTENDQLQYFTYYGGDKYFCQRKKLAYDFKTKTNYWKTYNFNNISAEKINELCDYIKALDIVDGDVNRFLSVQEVTEIDQDAIFYERRLYKKIAEKNSMLSSSDWRVLPDVVDTYPGEKDMWIKWRNILRNQTIREPNENETGLEYLKYIYDIKYPIDPKIYRELYPDGKDLEGNDVEYLSTQDQWVKYDMEASADFITINAVRALEHSKAYVDAKIKVKKTILDIIKAFHVDELYSNYDTDRFEEEI